MTKGKPVGVLLLALAAWCLVLLAPAQARAYCVYNLTNVQLTVCGGFCSSCMGKTIEPGQHSCCPGGDRGCNGASAIAFDVLYGHHWYNSSGCSGWKIDHAVDPHGWVTLSGTCTKSFKDCNSKKAQACDVTYVFYDKNGHVTHQGKAGYNGVGCPK